jgi:TRAP-type transport system periplasmic protein
MTGHIWAGLHTSFNLAAWTKLGPKIQDIAGHYFEEAALKERKDWADNLPVVTKSLQDHGMVFNTPDIEPFRALARKNGFYEEAKKRMGDEAWALLEKYTGKLA